MSGRGCGRHRAGGGRGGQGRRRAGARAAARRGIGPAEGAGRVGGLGGVVMAHVPVAAAGGGDEQEDHDEAHAGPSGTVGSEQRCARGSEGKVPSARADHLLGGAAAPGRGPRAWRLAVGWIRCPPSGEAHARPPPHPGRPAGRDRLVGLCRRRHPGGRSCHPRGPDARRGRAQRPGLAARAAARLALRGERLPPGDDPRPDRHGCAHPGQLHRRQQPQFRPPRLRPAARRPRRQGHPRREGRGDHHHGLLQRAGQLGPQHHARHHLPHGPRAHPAPRRRLRR